MKSKFGRRLYVSIVFGTLSVITCACNLDRFLPTTTAQPIHRLTFTSTMPPEPDDPTVGLETTLPTIHNEPGASVTLVTLTSTSPPPSLTPTFSFREPTDSIPAMPQLAFSTGGMSARRNLCRDVQYNFNGEPLIAASTHIDDIGALCLIGVKPGEVFTVSLYAPAAIRRVLQATKTFPNGLAFPELDYYMHEGIDIIEIPLWLPAGMPYGEWYASVESTSYKFGGSFTVREHQELPWVSIMPDRVYNPFEYSNACKADLPGISYSVGEILWVNGEGYASNREIAIAIFYVTDQYIDQSQTMIYSGYTAWSGITTTDSSGIFSFGLIVEPSDPSGLYLALPEVDLSTIGEDFWVNFDPPCFTISNN